MPDVLKPAAKAVAAFLAPIVVALIVGLADKVGVPINVDVGAAEAAILAVIGAAAVYVTRNRPE